MTCYRIGCGNEAKIGVRDRSNKVIVFCPPCFRELVRSNIIDRQTGEVMTT
ncbi:MAG: hypothetical protein ACRD8W_13505 [Nitrososphaeraceae archaeon]